MERTEFTPEVLEAAESTFVVREVPAKKALKRRIGFFTGDEQHLYTLEAAIQITKNYRKTSKKFGTSGAYFGRDIIEKILDQKTCVGIRFYYATHVDGNPGLVVTGAQTNNADLYQGILGQEYQLPANWSPEPNRLNSDSTRKASSGKKTNKVFTGRESQFVSLAEATQLARRYQQSIEYGEMKGGFFGSGIFRKILAQDGCVGIRAYHAIHDDGSPTFVLVGVDEYGYDLLAGIIGQGIFACPPWCYQMGPLNK